MEITFPSGITKVARTLLDTGTTKSIVLKNFFHGSQVQKMTKRSTKWTTKGGEFLTNKIPKVNFKIPELSTSKAVNWTCHLDEHTKPEYLPYNLIFGLDVLSALKIVINFVDITIKWDNNEIAMKTRGTIHDSQTVEL